MPNGLKDCSARVFSIKPDPEALLSFKTLQTTHTATQRHSPEE